MREILFRGKNAKGEWVEGFYIKAETDRIHNHFVAISDKEVQSTWYEVDPETVGQYTGLTDKNGKCIFEGDIVSVDGFIEISFIVIYHNGGFKLKEIGSEDLFAYYITETMIENEIIEIIGNIHDTLELMKGGAE